MKMQTRLLLISKQFLFPFLFFSFTANSAEEIIITIPSAAMKKEFKATVVLPDSYAQSQNRYSVIYLLHGFGGDHTVWPHIAPLKQCSDSLKLIFVCPDGDNSWYIDSPVRKKSMFETYVIYEVIPLVDTRYRTWPRSEGRAIMGVSMGGHGAISLLAKHPDLFTGACSIAGIMDLTEFPLEWNLSKIVGPLAGNERIWKEQSCIGMVDNLINGSKIIVLDCGTEDFALKGNQKEDELLQKAGIPHYFYTRHGTHDWHYVTNVVSDHILFLSKKLLQMK
jgi:putative tributyrin esterase